MLWGSTNIGPDPPPWLLHLSAFHSEPWCLVASPISHITLLVDLSRSSCICVQPGLHLPLLLPPFSLLDILGQGSQLAHLSTATCCYPPTLTYWGHVSLHCKVSARGSASWCIFMAHISQHMNLHQPFHCWS